jgi:DNA-binding SARP family transcriptional activator
VLQIELTLFGKPKLYINGEDVTPDRPTVFEVLCKVILSGEAGISRTEIATLMWPDLPISKARSNLRVNLANLRSELKSLGIADQFHLDDDVLRAKNAIKVDVKTILSKSSLLPSDLKHSTQPLAKGFDPDRWQREADLVVAHLASSFQNFRGAAPNDEMLSLLKAAVRSHPTSTQLTTSLLEALRLRNQVDQATQAIINFENAWINRFGVADLPTLSLDIPLPPVPEPAKPKRIFYTIPIICAIVLATVIFGPKQPAPVGYFPSLLVVGQKMESGFNVRKIEVSGTDPKNISPFVNLDQQPLLTDGSTFYSVMKSGYIKPFHNPTWLPKAQKSGVDVEISPDLTKLRVAIRGTERIITAITEYPYFETPKILADGSIVFSRVCGHTFRDHRKLCIWKDGQESQIHLTSPEPQNPVVICTADDGFYGKYSLGKKDSWAYHSFFFDIHSRKAKSLDIPIAVGIVGDCLLTRPETTELIRGDYRNHPLDYGLLIDNLGKKKKIPLYDQEDSLGIFGDYIYKCCKKSEHNWDLEFLNSKLEVVNPFPSVPKVVQSFTVGSDEVATCVEYIPEHNSKETILISRH